MQIITLLVREKDNLPLQVSLHQAPAALAGILDSLSGSTKQIFSASPSYI